MSPLVRAIWVLSPLLSAGCVLGAGIVALSPAYVGMARGCPARCPEARVAQRDATEGRVTIWVEGRPQTFEIVSNAAYLAAPRRGEQCTASIYPQGFLPGNVAIERGIPDAQRDPRMLVQLGCRLPAGRIVSMTLDLGDARGWREGERQIGVGSDMYRAPLGSCDATSKLAARLAVTRATGAAAPWPGLVTADYERAFEVELDVDPQVVAYEHQGTRCPAVEKIHLMASFRQVAADFTVDPESRCGCM
jgi:hypothetical protein